MTGRVEPGAERVGVVAAAAWLLLLAASWASAFMFVKFAVASLPPLTLSAIRVVTAAAALALIARASGAPLHGWLRRPALTVATGVFLVVLPVILLALSQQRIDTGVAAILAATLPLVTMVLAHRFTADERMTPRKVTGVLIGFSGVALLLGPAALAGATSTVWGMVIMAGAPLCYGIGLVLSRHLPPSPPLTRAYAATAVAVAILVPASLAVDAPWDLRPDAAALGAALFLGLVPTALGMFLSFRLMAMRGATFVAYANYLVPAIALVFGALIVGETITLGMLGALALVLGGIAIATLGGRRGAPRPAGQS